MSALNNCIEAFFPPLKQFLSHNFTLCSIFSLSIVQLFSWYDFVLVFKKNIKGSRICMILSLLTSAAIFLFSVTNFPALFSGGGYVSNNSRLYLPSSAVYAQATLSAGFNRQPVGSFEYCCHPVAGGLFISQAWIETIIKSCFLCLLTLHLLTVITQARLSLCPNIIIFKDVFFFKTLGDLVLDESTMPSWSNFNRPRLSGKVYHSFMFSQFVGWYMIDW